MKIVGSLADLAAYIVFTVFAVRGFVTIPRGRPAETAIGHKERVDRYLAAICYFLFAGICLALTVV